MALMQWHLVTRAQFSAGTPIDGHLYFLTDEHLIYRGNESGSADLYTKSMEFYTGELSATGGAPYRIYVNSATLEGHIWDGSKWNQIIKPLADTVTTDGVNPVSGKAVADYVATQIAGITGSGTVLTGASWDGENAVLTLNKGDGNTIDLTLEGLGYGLSYEKTTGLLTMLDVNGNAVPGAAVNLDLERFIKSGEYDEASGNIILYFDDEKTDYVEIPVGELVDTYTAESSATLTLEVAANVIKGAVKISAEAGNALVAKDDGLYVAPVDVSGKMDKDTDAVAGDIAVFDENGNAVDSGKTFDDLASTPKLYSGASIDEATTGATPKAGDICVVETPIGSSDKVERTAYFHDGTQWCAMDGNYNAENVYFASDLETTVAIGNITLSNGMATIAAAGKNLKEVWETIFVKEKNPTSNTAPYVTITANNNKAYEVGTTVTPTYTATLNPGKYQYGPDTGITASAWSVVAKDGSTTVATKDTNSGSFDAIEVGDSTSYIITATATHNEGAIPVTNRGNAYEAAKFAAGTKSKSSAAITGFRRAFWGYSADFLTQDDITSAIIRGLQNKSDAAVKVGSTFDVKYVAGTKTVIIAYPATIADMSSCLDMGAMQTPIQKAHDFTVDVEGANGYAATSYKVWLYTFADGASADNTYAVTI